MKLSRMKLNRSLDLLPHRRVSLKGQKTSVVEYYRTFLQEYPSGKEVGPKIVSRNGPKIVFLLIARGKLFGRHHCMIIKNYLMD